MTIQHYPRAVTSSGTFYVPSPPPPPKTQAAHRGLSRWYLLLVEDKQLLQVVGGTRLLQFIFDVPDQVILGLRTRPHN